MKTLHAEKIFFDFWDKCLGKWVYFSIILSLLSNILLIFYSKVIYPSYMTVLLAKIKLPEGHFLSSYQEYIPYIQYFIQIIFGTLIFYIFYALPKKRFFDLIYYIALFSILFFTFPIFVFIVMSFQYFLSLIFQNDLQNIFYFTLNQTFSSLASALTMITYFTFLYFGVKIISGYKELNLFKFIICIFIQAFLINQTLNILHIGVLQLP